MENSRFKFRAWDKANNRFVNHNQWLNNTEVSASVLVQSILTINHQGWVIMQYTGLKDKNGVEIYEGDIVKAPHCFGVGGFEDRTFTVYFNMELGSYQWNYWLMEQAEVIGNIYENPELLEDKQ